MADLNIDELPEDTAPAAVDFIVTSDQSSGPATRKVTLANAVDLAPLRGSGEISVTTPVATVLSDTSTFVPILGTFAASAGAVNFDMPLNGRLRYTGTKAVCLHIAAAASMTAASNNQTIEFVIMKNGIAIAPSRIQRRVATGADVGAASFHGFIDVVTNDYIEIGVRNITSASNITATTANLFAEALG